MNLEYKIIVSGLAIALTFAIFIPYIRSILKGDIKPHVFSWIIWGLGTFVVFAAQLADQGGVGAWPIGVSACITCFIAILAFSRRGDAHITQTDWYFFVAAISALPLWWLTSNPLWAVVLLTVSDLIGFGPTLRNAYTFPEEESVAFFAFSAVRNTLVVIALENYSITTVLFPAAVGVACIIVASFLLYRRRMQSKL